MVGGSDGGHGEIFPRFHGVKIQLGREDAPEQIKYSTRPKSMS